MQVSNTQDELRFAQALQASVAEGGFDLEIVPVEYSTLLDVQKNGTFEALAARLVRPDRPGRQHLPLPRHRQGRQLQRVLVVHIGRPAGESDPDHRRRPSVLRSTGRRSQLLQKENPVVYTYRLRNLTVHSTRVTGIEVYTDGVVRLGKAAFVAGED